MHLKSSTNEFNKLLTLESSNNFKTYIYFQIFFVLFKEIKIEEDF